jgi:O-acetyl-ADP-ribose deacetylase (regulator of RNase III)
MTKIFAVRDDITTQKVDVVVNAANNTLLGGGGVDGAIHFAAGEELLEECKTLDGCKTGEAKMTKGYNLLAKFVIHTVGPIYGVDGDRSPELLEACYKNSMQLAYDKKLKTIAFPCISTGVFCYPKNEASQIAIKTVKKFLKDHKDNLFEEIRFIVFSDLELAIYGNNLNN